MSSKSKMKNALSAIEGARGALRRAMSTAGDDAIAEIRKAIRELDDAEEDIRRAIRQLPDVA